MEWRAGQGGRHGGVPASAASAAEGAALRRLRASATMASARGAPAEAGRGPPALGLGSDSDFVDLPFACSSSAPLVVRMVSSGAIL
jgi:hypothetical protein